MKNRLTVKRVQSGAIVAWLVCLIIVICLCRPESELGRVLRLAQATAAPVIGAPDIAEQAVNILRQSCWSCHGEDRMSGLDLRTRAGAVEGGGRGVAIRPGKPEESLLYQYLTGKASPRMPLGAELSGDQIELLRKWIAEGAPWPAEIAAKSDPLANSPASPAASGVEIEAVRGRITAQQRQYWAFQRPVAPPIPSVRNRSWVANPIDAFILSQIESQKLQPSAPADRRTLIRRVTYDLTGLPPTPEEIDNYLADQSPDAYEKVVRRLLASPRYGERWAQHWLDVVRFAETNGFELDQDREQAWRYRDYIVKSLNEDKPYDRFIREQLAGDELAPDDFEMRVATGFLRAGPQHVVAGNLDEAVNRQEWLTEVMFGVGNGVMGLTVGCARCHDHKFDPILQADFYRLQSFFAAADNVDYQRSGPSAEAAEAALKSAQAAHKERLKPISEQLAAIEKPYQDRLKAAKRAKLEPIFTEVLDKPAEKRSEQEKQLAKDAQRMLNVNWEELLAALSPEDRARRAGLRQQMHRINLTPPEPLPKALAVSDALSPVPPMHLLKAGDPHRPAAEVRPGFLTVLLPADASWDAEISPIRKGEFKSTGRKLALANWLTRPDHPLTARVMVNRLWHYHFGRGIVPTPNDFGRNGQPPTHPQLLDWLATQFVGGGWSLKQLHFMMVTSNTYRQSTDSDPVRAARDPENKWLWRMNRQRLDAEAIRDSTLAIAGTLTEELGGPSIRVPLEPEVYDTIFTEAEPDNLWPVHPDSRQHNRRSLYLLRKRNVRLPMLVAFDSPDMMSSCGARSVSVHALQSLTLLNSGFMLDQSAALAGRVLTDSDGDTSRAIDRLYRLALGRRPRLAELSQIRSFLTQQTAIISERLRKGEPVASLRLPPGQNRMAANLTTAQPTALAAARNAAWIDLCLATMNTNDFLYLR
jgi:mono/diheme cytochrome c family protein